MLEENIRPLMKVKVTHTDVNNIRLIGTVVGDYKRSSFCVEFEKQTKFSHQNNPKIAGHGYTAYKDSYRQGLFYYWYPNDDLEPVSQQLELNFEE